MSWIRQNNEIVSDTIEQPTLLTPPRLTVPTVRDDSAPSIQSLRAPIQLIEPDTVRVEQPAPAMPRQVIPTRPPALSTEDSLKLNLKGNEGLFINWQVNYNRSAYLEEISVPRIDDSLWNQLVLTEKEAFQEESLEWEFDETDEPGSTEIHITHPTVPGLDAAKHPDVQSDLRGDWMSGLLVFAVLVLGFVRLNWNRYMKDAVLSIAYPALTNRMTNSNASNSIPSFLLGFLFYFNSTLFIYQILTYSNNSFLGFTGPIIIPLIFLFLYLLFTSKMLVYRVVGKIFGTSENINDYLSNASSTSKAFSILILPLILFFPFVDSLLQEILIRAGLGLFIILYLRQITRGVKINFSNPLSGYYIILYLCGLEILPLSILFKVLFK